MKSSTKEILKYKVNKVIYNIKEGVWVVLFIMLGIWMIVLLGVTISFLWMMVTGELQLNLSV